MTTNALTQDADVDRQLACFIEQTGDELADFDVLNYAAPVWPHLYLLDVVADDRLMVRVMGQHIRDMVGQSCSGRHLDDFMHGPRSRDVMGAYAACVREGRPVCMTQCVVLPERPILTVKACAVPLFSDGRVAKVTGLMHGITSNARHSLFESQSRFEAHWMSSRRTGASVAG